MQAVRWRRLREAFDRLVDTQPDAWVTRLEEDYPGESDFHVDVLAMLQADQVAAHQDSRLASHAPLVLDELSKADDDRDSQAWIGRHLGAWRIVRPIGRGGMGMVYLAERDEGGFRHQAALKLLSNRRSESTLERFVAERQILADLVHPNIARLIDGGNASDAGPWFALEYVDGVPLTAWCDARQLSINQRLDLFLDVCRAVTYAHEHLVIHRDIKPGNILVDVGGEVKLLDFGIAKLIEENGAQTATAIRVFTPEYAAPEQVRGERMTTAVDVYSLGVLLYELLTGRLPYRMSGVTGAALEFAIVDQQPVRPSGVVTQPVVVAGLRDGEADELAARRALTPQALKTRLRGDLDAILLKALRKEPDQRYGSVREFAVDVEAFVDNRPVAARSGGLRYTVNRFIRRNRLAVALAGVALLALIIGLMAALIQAREARVQRDSAQAEAAKARQALDFMNGLFKSADPGTNARSDLSVRDLLDQGVRDIRFTFSDQPDARQEMLVAMASAYLSIFLPEQAKPLIEEASMIANGQADPVALAEVAVLRCRSLNGERRNEECAALSRDAESGLDPSRPGHAEIMSRLITVRLAGLTNQADYVKAEEEARRAIVLLGDRPEHLSRRASLTQWWTGALVQLGRNEEAEAIMKALLVEMRASSSALPRDLASSLAALASTLDGPDRMEEKVALHREALSILEDVYGVDHPALLNSMNNLAVALHRADDFGEAIDLMERVVAIRSRHFGATHASTALSLANLGGMVLGTGDDGRALASLDKAIAIYERDPPRPSVASALAWRAATFMAQARFDEARSDLGRANALLSGRIDPANIEMLRIRSMRVALSLTERRSTSDRVADCAEARLIASVYEASADRNSNNARFVEFLVETVCADRLDQKHRDAALSRLETALPKQDFRLRLARNVLDHLDAQR